MIKQQVLPHCTPTHTTDSMTPVHAPRASFPSNHKCFSGILTTWCVPQRSVSPRSAWQREASAARRSQRRLVCRCRPRSAKAGVHRVFFVDAAAASRDEEAVGVSRKTHISRSFSDHCSLCSIPRFKRSFLFGSVWLLAVSPAAFFLVFVVCHASSSTFLGCAPCSCCCSHVHG